MDAVGMSRPSDDWSPARIFLAVSTAYHLVLAVVGLAINRSFPVGRDETEHAASDHIFGIFETNGWHSLAGLLVAAASFYFMLRPERARVGALAIGLSQLIVVVAFALVPPSIFWFASNGAVQVIHSITAIGGIGSAMLTRRTRSPAFASPGAAL